MACTDLRRWRQVQRCNDCAGSGGVFPFRRQRQALKQVGVFFLHGGNAFHHFPSISGELLEQFAHFSMRGVLSIVGGRAFSCFYLIGDLSREALDLSLQRVDLLGLCLGGWPSPSPGPPPRPAFSMVLISFWSNFRSAFIRCLMTACCTVDVASSSTTFTGLYL